MMKNCLKHTFFLFSIFGCFAFQSVTQVPKGIYQKQVISFQKPKLCLTMIVKNEEKIIERCLDSVKDVVDCIVISDTGSTDNTVKIIETFLQKNGIPGKVYHHEWKNFGHNRSLSVKSAQEALKELFFPLQSTYLLFLDADMILEKESSFQKESLKDDSYLLIQKTPSLSYYNLRLARASLPWECVGVTHEYWACKTPCNRSQLTSLSINDREDGGSKADKFIRDIRLLTQGLKDEPDNERYMFYLAQSYKCLKQFDDSIKWYKARIDKGGWKEEVWYSKLMIGEMYEEMEAWDQALHWYLEAYQFHPSRAESLQKITNYYRRNNQNSLAHLFAKHGKDVPYPKEDILFISHPVYDYQFDEEISISAFYTPFKEEGYHATNRLILNKKAPSYIRDNAYKNMVYYANNIENMKTIPIQAALPPLRAGSTEKYNPMNPSILKTEKGYTVILRTVNWAQTGGNHYHSRDPKDDTIRTTNYLLEYTPDFKLLSQREIIENLPRVRHPSQIQGMEDCRLVSLNNENYFLCTCYDTSPGGIKQCLCKIDQSSTVNAAMVEKFVPLKGPDASRCEKNWLPFVKNNSLHVIYSYDPLIIYEVNRETGDLTVQKNIIPQHHFARFRGSAGPIEFDKGYLVMVHEVAHSNQRHYMHRFLYLDKDFNIVQLSKPFTFEHMGIEYCCGMTTDHAGNNLVMTLGIEDREAKFGIVGLDVVREMLEPLPE